MIKKGPAMRLCMCCGEKKLIEKDETYCKDCSTPAFGSSVLDVAPTIGKKQGLYNIKSL